MDYNPLLNLPDVLGLFTGERGSKYAFHSDMSTTGYRTPSNHPASEPPSLQKKSHKTLFMDKRSADFLGSWVDDEHLGTKLIPVKDKNNNIKAVSVVVDDMSKVRQNSNAQSKNPIRKNDVVATLPVSRFPEVGLQPVEFGKNSFTSPLGVKAREEGLIHFGNNIKSLDTVSPKSVGSKLGIAGALLGAAGAANAGEYRKAAGDVAESFIPFGLTPSALGDATLSKEQKEFSNQATAVKQAAEREAVLNKQALLRSGVPMPDDFAVGGRVRLI